MLVNVCLVGVGVLFFCAKRTNGGVSSETSYLTQNLFAGLNADPYLLVEGVTERSVKFIDEKIESYRKLTERRDDVRKRSMNRRSLPSEVGKFSTEPNAGIYNFEGFIPLDIIKPQFARDLQLFRQNNSWFAVALEASQALNFLALYNYGGDAFREIKRLPITNATILGVFPARTFTFIVLCNYKKEEKLTAVFKFNSKLKFVRVQSLDSMHVFDVAIWESHHEKFLALAQRDGFKTNIEIFKWAGRHFDLFDQIVTEEARSLSPFAIGRHQFLAVAIYKNENGETKTFSEIYKYDLNEGVFTLQQRISTKAAVDVRYFQIAKEHFLVIANHHDEGLTNYNVVYKYVDDYFFPFQVLSLNSVRQWLPVRGPSGEFILLANTKFDGIRAFTYDGWRFAESDVSYSPSELLREIASMHSYFFQERVVLVIASQSNEGESASILELKFSRNDTPSVQEELLNWCEGKISEIEMLDKDEIVKAVQQAPTSDKGELEFSEPVAFDNVTVKSLHIMRSDDTDGEDYPESPEITKLMSLNDRLGEQIRELENLEKIIDSIGTFNPNFLEGDVQADKVIVTEDAFLDSLTSESINTINVVDFLQNLIHISENLTITDEPVSLADVRVENPISPAYINGKSSGDLLHVSDDASLGDVHVTGNVIVGEGVTVQGTLNGIEFNENSLLLREGDQIFPDEANIEHAVVNNTETNSLNTLQLSEATFEKPTLPVTNITNLRVGNLTVSGYLNQIHLPTINKHVLQTSGDQEITKEYTFDHVHVNGAVRFNGRLNGRTLEDLIPISEGTYTIEQDVEFTDTLNIANLTVRNRLNQIEIRDGKLDVLFKDSEDPQYVKGNKHFHNVDLQNFVHLQAQIKRKGLDELKPITMIEENLFLKGDFVIKGNTVVEKLLATVNIKPVDGGRSLNDVEENGLKITDEQLAFHVEFTQPISVNEINADQINGVDPNSFVVCGGDEVQYVKGQKQILGDVYVTGVTVLKSVNGMDVSNLEAEVLTLDNDQEVIGKLHVRNLVVDKLQCANAKLGDNWWKDVVSPENNQPIGGTTLIHNSLIMKELDVDFLNLNGLINGYNFTRLINDAVAFDNQHVIKGHKTLGNFTVDHLEVINGLDMSELSDLISRPEVVFQFAEDVTLPDRIHVENANIEGSINGLSSEDFKKSWTQGDGDQVYDQKYSFDSVVVYGKMYVSSDYINEVKMEDLVLNTIKIDEPFQFDDVTFTNKITSKRPLILHGHISGLDLENTVLICDGEQTITGPVIFKDNVTIEGSLFAEGLINGFHLPDLCEFASPTVTETPKTLIINGSAHFSKGPVIKRIGGVPFEDILENAWISDRETELEGYIEFEEVVFHDDIHVEGLVNEVSLEFLADNYFSKSLNQTITGHLDFTEGVNFLDGVSASEARLYGTVFGIDLGGFVKTAILDDVDQIFDDTLLLETCNVQDVQGEYLVNDLNLQRDVMRYDADNILTGRKTIPNVLTYTLVIGGEVKVQDVNLANWIQRGVLKTGNHAIVGQVSFYGNVTFSNGLGLIGLINGREFNKNSVLLYSEPQNITGKKTFRANSIKFARVNLKGRLNNVDLVQLVSEQSFKNEDAIYDSQVSLSGGALIENLNIEKLYNGVDVGQLVHNLTLFASLNNYYDSYASLLDASNKVRKSLRFQSFYLDYYKAVQVFANVKFVHPLQSENKSSLVVVRCVNDANLIDFYMWDSQRGNFVLDMSNMKIVVNSELSYVNTLEFSEKTYLYSEYITENVAQEGNYVTNIFDTFNKTSLRIVQQIRSNGTKFVKAFTMKRGQRNCVIVIYVDKLYTNVLCESEDDNDDNEDLLVIHQQLETTAPSVAVTLEITDSIYLLIVNAESEEREAHVDVWKSDTNTGLFNLHQIMFVIAPKSIAATFYKGVYYLAIGSGHLENATFTGTVEIRRFDVKSERFVHMQDINLPAPVTVEFAILPTDELILYILSDSVTEPLIIYMYEGVSGFVRKATITTPMKFSHMCPFTTHTKDHFVITQNEAEVHIIKAIFKGQR